MALPFMDMLYRLCNFFRSIIQQFWHLSSVFLSLLCLLLLAANFNGYQNKCPRFTSYRVCFMFMERRQYINKCLLNCVLNGCEWFEPWINSGVNRFWFWLLHHGSITMSQLWNLLVDNPFFAKLPTFLVGIFNPSITHGQNLFVQARPISAFSSALLDLHVQVAILNILFRMRSRYRFYDILDFKCWVER